MSSHIEPATIASVEGTELYRVTLTEEAAERLGIQTAPVSHAEGEGSGTQRTVIPFSAVVYETDGDTWTYTSPEPLVFVRHRITVESVDGDMAVLSDGPPLGTEVVTVGAALLLGVESGVGQ